MKARVVRSLWCLIALAAWLQSGLWASAAPLHSLDAVARGNHESLTEPTDDVWLWGILNSWASPVSPAGEPAAEANLVQVNAGMSRSVEEQGVAPATAPSHENPHERIWSQTRSPEPRCPASSSGFPPGSQQQPTAALSIDSATLAPQAVAIIAPEGRDFLPPSHLRALFRPPRHSS
jgi:hypothetical protein